MLTNFNEVLTRASCYRCYRSSLDLPKEKNKTNGNSVDGACDLSAGMTLANATKDKLVGKDSVSSNQHLLRNPRLELC